MSRSTVAKSRQEKTNKVASAPTPAVTHEIVPGKFNDQDWNSMLDHDDGEDFIHGIVEEVCSSAMDTIFQNYIEKQLIPYTVSQAKDALLQIIEWQFLSFDPGETIVETDPEWAEDEEPEPAFTDCWAQGSVPIRLLPTPVPETIQEETEALEQTEEESSDKPDITVEAEHPQLLTEPTVIVEEKTSMAIEETIQPRKEDDVSTQDTPKLGKKKKRGYKPHTGPVRIAGMDAAMTESLDKTEMKMMIDEYQEQNCVMAGSPDPLMQQMPSSCQSILKLQAGRPPGNRDVVYDEHGNVVSVTKLDPERLPTHSVRTRFVIMDPSEEPKKNGVQMKFHVIDPSDEASRYQQEAMMKGKALKPHPPSASTARSSKGSKKHRSFAPFSRAQNKQEAVTPLPPPLLESMQLAPGVIVKEGDRIKKGPKQKPKQVDLIATATQRGLHAIHIKSGDPLLSVSQILQHQEPIIKPIVATPIPPIQSPPQQQH